MFFPSHKYQKKDAVDFNFHEICFLGDNLRVFFFLFTKISNAKED